MGATPAITLVLGGARSGKSAYAERLVRESGLSRVYLATGRAFDPEMEARIEQHQQDRGEGWTTIEAPLDLVATLKRETGPDRMVLVDCLTLWVTNLMMAEHNVAAEAAALVECLGDGLPGPVVLVSNEVGLGIVPDNKMARDFRDHAGRLHQDIAAVANHVVFVAAGLPLKLKG